jgi:hypothetical protein
MKVPYPKITISGMNGTFHHQYSQISALAALSRISMKTHSSELTRAKNQRLGTPRIKSSLSFGSILMKTIPRIANMSEISMFRPTKIR